MPYLPVTPTSIHQSVAGSAWLQDLDSLFVRFVIVGGLDEGVLRCRGLESSLNNFRPEIEVSDGRRMCG